ncbi:hypothetical protein P9112_002433 [Eukaryota sp. TZLM1-RC]
MKHNRKVPSKSGLHLISSRKRLHTDSAHVPVTKTPRKVHHGALSDDEDSPPIPIHKPNSDVPTHIVPVSKKFTTPKNIRPDQPSFLSPDSFFSPGAKQLFIDLSTTFFTSPESQTFVPLNLLSIDEQLTNTVPAPSSPLSFPSDHSVESVLPTLFPPHVASYLITYLSSKGISSLFEPQVEALFGADRHGSVLNGSSLLFEAPTSAGKSLVVYLLIVRRLVERLNSTTLSGKRILFIVPFVALAEQHCRALLPFVEPLGVRVQTIHGGSRSSAFLARSCYQVVICTQELANSLLNKWLLEEGIGSVLSVVVDELHAVSLRRGQFIELVLTKLMYLNYQYMNINKNKTPLVPVIGLSATFTKSDILSSWLKAVLVQSSFRPLPITTGIVEFNSLFNKAKEHLEQGHRVIVFVTRRDDTRKYSHKLSTILNAYQGIPSDSPRKSSLSSPELVLSHLEQQNLIQQVNKNSILAGVGFHHALLPDDFKSIMEKGFTDGGLCCLITTSTLSYGVNLPCDVVFIPITSKLGGSDVKQMAGRCGRFGISNHGFVYGVSFNSLEKDSNLFHNSLNESGEELSSQLTSLDTLGQLVLDGICTGIATQRDDLRNLLEFSLLRRVVPSNQFATLFCEAVDFLEANNFISSHLTSPPSFSVTTKGSSTHKVGISASEAHQLRFSLQEHVDSGFSLRSDFHVLRLVVPDFWFFSRIPLNGVIDLNVLEFLFRGKISLSTLLPTTINTKFLCNKRSLSALTKWKEFGPFLFEKDPNFDLNSETQEVVKRIEYLKILRNISSCFNALIANYLIEGKSYSDLVFYLNHTLQSKFSIIDFDHYSGGQFEIYQGDIEEFHRTLVRRTKMLIQFSQENEYLSSILKVLFPRIQFTAPSHLLPLVRLEHCSVRHAKVLFAAGVTTPLIVSQMNISELVSVFNNGKVFSEFDSEEFVLNFCKTLINDAKLMTSLNVHLMEDSTDLNNEGKLPTINYFELSQLSEFYSLWKTAKLWSFHADFLMNKAVHVALSFKYPSENGEFQLYTLSSYLQQNYRNDLELEFDKMLLEMLLSKSHQMVSSNFYTFCDCNSNFQKASPKKPDLFMDFILNHYPSSRSQLLNTLTKNPVFDLVLISNLLRSSSSESAPTSLHSIVLGQRLLHIERHLFSHTAVPTVNRISCLMLEIYAALNDQFKTNKMENLVEIECKSTAILTASRIFGVKISRDQLFVVNKSVNNLIFNLTNFFTTSTSYPCNPQGFKQFLQLKLGLEDGATNLESLELIESRLQSRQSDPVDIRVIKSMKSIKTLEALKDFCVSLSNLPSEPRLTYSLAFTDNITGRVHTICPNLQSTPKVRHFEGFDVDSINCRSVITSSLDGFCLLSLDFRQIELRLMAHLSLTDALNTGDSRAKQNALSFIALFSSSADIFEAMKQSWLQCSQKGVTASRDEIKRIVYALIYGMGNEKLSQVLTSSSLESAASMKEEFLNLFPAISDLITTTRYQVEQENMVSSLLNRQFSFTPLDGMHRALNFRIQSSASEVFKTALASVYERITVLNESNDCKACIILTIHDEILMEVPQALCNLYAKDALLAMTDVQSKLSLNVPLEVSLNKGQNWGDLKSFKV